MTLTPLPVARSSMEPGQLYIWHIEGNRYAVVTLAPTEDAVVALHRRDDEWFFRDNLVGHLYGPIALSLP